MYLVYSLVFVQISVVSNFYDIPKYYKWQYLDRVQNVT